MGTSSVPPATSNGHESKSDGSSSSSSSSSSGGSGISLLPYPKPAVDAHTFVSLPPLDLTSTDPSADSLEFVLRFRPRVDPTNPYRTVRLPVTMSGFALRDAVARGDVFPALKEFRYPSGRPCNIVSDVLVGKDGDGHFLSWDATDGGLHKTIADLLREPGSFKLVEGDAIAVHLRPEIPSYLPNIRANRALLDRFAISSREKGRASEKDKWLPLDEVRDGMEVALRWTYDLNAGWVAAATYVTIDHRCFAEGMMRRAHHMRDMSDGTMSFVAKFAKDELVQKGQGAGSRRGYFEDVKMQQIAMHWANEFNRRNPPKRVEFIRAFVYELPFRDSSKPWTNLCGAEQAIHGTFRKYNNNTGWVTESDPMRNTPQAFSHFTYEASGRELVVVDVQGVQDKNVDVYTDPQIHTRDGLGFSLGNQGQRGIDAFLATHECNAVCRRVGLPSVGGRMRPGWQTSGTGAEAKIQVPSTPRRGSRVSRRGMSQSTSSLHRANS